MREGIGYRDAPTSKNKLISVFFFVILGHLFKHRGIFFCMLRSEGGWVR